MVALGEEQADPELGSGPPAGATEFFTRPRPPEEPPELAAAPPPAPGGAVPPPAVPMGAPPIGAPLGIRGPIASGPTPIATPAGTQAAPHVGAGVQRAQSYRVFAVVIGLSFMVLLALTVTVIITVMAVMGSDDTPEAVAPETTERVAPKPTLKQVDTGTRPAPRPLPVGRGIPRTSSRTPPAPAPVRPRPSSGPGTITLTIAESSFSSVQVSCPSGFRDRQPIRGGKMVMSGVPREACTAFFKGGPPAKTQVSGGDTKTCTFVGAAMAASCR